MFRFVPIGIALLSLGAPVAAWQESLWLPATEQATTGFGDAVTKPRYASMRRTVLAAEAALRRNGALARIPEVRLRASRFIGVPGGPGQPLTGRVSAFLFPPRAWDGPRGLKPYAMRINGGFLTIVFNEVREIFESGKVLEDEELTAWQEPPVTGQAGGRPVFYGEKVVLTRGGVPAWIPVTVAEHLAYQRRQLARQRQELEKAAATTASARIDEGQAKATYAALQKTDPKAAAEFLATMAQVRRQLDQGRADAAREVTRQRVALQGQQAVLERRIAALTPAERTVQATVGAVRLVRFNPALWEGVRGEGSVHLIVVRLFANDAARYRAPLARALEEVDFSALEALLTRGTIPGG